MNPALTVNADVTSGAPCRLCGVRPDVACRHRPAVGAPPRPDLPADNRLRRDFAGQGFNFRRRELPRGKILVQPQPGTPHQPSGAELIARLEARAAELGLRPSALSGYHCGHLRQIRAAKRPTAQTVARIEAAIARPAPGTTDAASEGSQS